MFKILISDQDRIWKDFLEEALHDFYEITFPPDSGDIFAKLKSNHYDLIILDLTREEERSFDILRRIKSGFPGTAVIITSRTEKAEMVVTALKKGAVDFIAKPFSAERIRVAVQQALENRGLKNEIDYLRHNQDIIYNFDQIIAFSPAVKEVIKTLKKFSKTDSTILMTGETGTGKSFLSGSIHFNSRRRSRPFVKINCSNIPENLLESELFGHEKGAFTGADKLRIGRFEQARGGTLFLDEIGEISLFLQAKLLRVLEEKCFERIGGNQTIHADVRVIAATNKKLEKQIAEGKFREDLYYRINVLSVMLPPLRERKECIEPFAHLLLDKTCRSLRKRVDGFSPQVIEWMKDYPWPGNIRQLGNTIERAVILVEGRMIREENISMLEPVRPTQAQTEVISTETLESHEKEQLLKALKKSLWIQKDAAKHLGISPRALNYKIKKFGITHPRWRKNK
ncbi:MAG: sigma-54 dependent transcriptional regulator [Desulfobacterales bacterium]|nr:sigma-54 dependent transcriptional regulator [Desulfobacterales bacterium]